MFSVILMRNPSEKKRRKQMPETELHSAVQVDNAALLKYSRDLVRDEEVPLATLAAGSWMALCVMYF